ncbi:MAG: CBS domain-containing protein [Actinomycetota bacterium]|nr:MAG: CBS domain-containing protein [Actinomycetota bacterium]
MSEGYAGGRGPLLRLWGVPVHVPASGVVGVALIAVLWAPNFVLSGAPASQQYALAVIFAVLLYLSILLHEAAHAFAARAFGYPVTKIVLWVLGGFTQYERARPAPGKEAAIAAAGPLTTLAVAGLAYLALAATGDSLDVRAVVVLEALAWGNAFMGLYNLLPGLPLDGGAVLRSAVWALTGSENRGAVVAGWAGRGLAVLMIVTPFALAFARDVRPSLGLVVVAAIFAAFLWTGASDALRRARVNRHIPGLSARRLARRAVNVDADLPLAEAIRRMTAAGARSIVVVDRDGRPIGVGEDAAIAAVPPARQPWLAVSAVARTLHPTAVLPASLTGYDLVEAVTAHPATEYLVVDDEAEQAAVAGSRQVVGVLTTADVENELRTGPHDE